MDKAFSLQDNLAHTRLILESLTSISPPRTVDIDPGSVREAVKLALDRKQNANAWIKAALASDLNPVFDHRRRTINVEAPSAARRSTKASHGNKRQVTLNVWKQTGNNELHVGLPTDVENQPDWVKGNASSISAELANSLHKECGMWFLTYVEDYLDWVCSKTTSRISDNQVAGMMYQIKRVNDWLDTRCKDTSTLEDSELEACGRLRNKIYEILLKHVERTAMNAIAEC